MPGAAEVPDLAAITKGLSRGAGDVWYAEHRPVVSFPEAGYAENREVEDNSFWFRHRSRCILELISVFPPPGDTAIFDIGGGTGCVTAAIQGAGHPVVLVEPGKPGVEMAKARGVEHIVCGTLEGAGFMPGSVGAAGMFDVLEHIENDGKFLLQLHELMAKNGRLYLAVPAYQQLWSDEDVYAGHFRRYSVKSIAKVLDMAGFEMDFCSHIFRWLPVPIYLFRTLPYLLSGRKGNLEKSDTKGDHQVNRGWVSKAMDAVFSVELGRIRSQSPIGFGGSILISASAR